MLLDLEVPVWVRTRIKVRVVIPTSVVAVFLSFTFVLRVLDDIDSGGPLSLLLRHSALGRLNHTELPVAERCLGPEFGWF